MSTDPPVLEARGLAKRYRRGVWALGGIDLAMQTGGITALVGPNAAGKSTLMRTWVGFERPTRGEARVVGLDLLDIPISADSRQLSGGQQAQVALALVLGTSAEILLLDEPLASLDPLARREFLHVLTDGVRASGATAVLSSHIVTDVEQACDALIVLGVGRVLLHDSIPRALASHSVADGPPNLHRAAPPVGTFLGPDGEPLRLFRTETAMLVPTGRPASLEEIVMGYLASARAPSAQPRAAP